MTLPNTFVRSLLHSLIRHKCHALQSLKTAGSACRSNGALPASAQLPAPSGSGTMMAAFGGAAAGGNLAEEVSHAAGARPGLCGEFILKSS